MAIQRTKRSVRARRDRSQFSTCLSMRTSALVASVGAFQETGARQSGDTSGRPRTWAGRRGRGRARRCRRWPRRRRGPARRARGPGGACSRGAAWTRGGSQRAEGGRRYPRRRRRPGQEGEKGRRVGDERLAAASASRAGGVVEYFSTPSLCAADGSSARSIGHVGRSPASAAGSLNFGTHHACHYKYKESFPHTRESIRRLSRVRGRIDSRFRGNDSRWFFWLAKNVAALHLCGGRPCPERGLFRGAARTVH